MPALSISRRRFLRAGTVAAATALCGCSTTNSSPGAPSTSGGSSTGVPSGTVTTTLPVGLDHSPAPAPAGATRYRPLRPTRLVDTRRSGGWTQVTTDRIRIPVAGRVGVPPDAVAVALRVTGLDGGGVGVAPAADEPASEAADDGLATTSMSFVLLGNGDVDVRYGDGDGPPLVTVDVEGYFETATTATAGGRFVTTPPTVVLDTGATARPFGASETRSVTPSSAWPTGVLAVVVRITATADGSVADWSVHSSRDPDLTPTLTVIGDSPATTSTVVALTGGGFDVTSSTGGHAVVEVVGHVTGDEAEVSIDGLFVPVTPTRLLDTRLTGQPIPAGSCREVSAGPERSGALAIAVTGLRSTDGASDTIVSSWPAGSAPESGQQLPIGQANGSTATVVTPTGLRGVAFGAAGGDAHVVADLYGWFVGDRSTERLPPCGAAPYGIDDIEMESFAAEWLDYGTSTDGRPLRAFRHGSGPRVGLISTGLHGNELTGTSVLADLVTRDPIPGWTLWLVPVANPDARAVNERYVHDVDMNRDFPVEWSPLPSPTGSGCVTTRTGPRPHTLVESGHLARAMVDGPFRSATISISHHDNYNWVAPQAGSPAVLRELADDYARATGLRLPGEDGGVVPTSPRATRVDGGFETYADSLGMASFLVENKAGFQGGSFCAGEFGMLPQREAVEPHYEALRTLLTDGRVIDQPTG